MAEERSLNWEEGLKYVEKEGFERLEQMLREGLGRRSMNNEDYMKVTTRAYKLMTQQYGEHGPRRDGQSAQQFFYELHHKVGEEG
jgi:hypothetical protein